MTLQNKLGIDDAFELAQKEELLSKRRALELYDKGLLDASYSYEGFTKYRSKNL